MLDPIGAKGCLSNRQGLAVVPKKRRDKGQSTVFINCIENTDNVIVTAHALLGIMHVINFARGATIRVCYM